MSENQSGSGHSHRVFVETSTIKLSTTSRTVLIPREETLQWGGREMRVTVHDIVDLNPNDRIRDPKFREEVDLLPQIADLAKAGVIELLTHGEVSIELMGVTNVGRPRTVLLEAPITYVDSPLQYSRIVSGSIVPNPSVKRPWQRAQVEFLLTIKHARFLELRRLCGADQGDKVKENQLIDAFHVWCAEEAGATDFLTCDLKLIRLVRNRKEYPLRLRIVSPSELLDQLASTH